MEFNLLGPLEVIRDGRAIPVDGQRKKIILAMLLLEPGRVISVSRLVDAIWGEAPPQTARDQVQIAISALRRTFDASQSIIVTRSPGYLITVPGTAMDHMRFESLIAESESAEADRHAEEAIQGLRAALALWRGNAAEGIASDAVQGAVARLNERRLAVHQKCIELELRLGRGNELIGELTQLTTMYPLHEPFRAQLMLALYRGGRPAEALEVFQVARYTLREELGLDPGEELAQVERAILARDPRLNGAANVEWASLPGSSVNPGNAGLPMAPRQLPMALPNFVGREEQTEHIRALIEQGINSSYVSVVVLAGRGGAGKTALALRIAHEVRDAFPDGQIFVQLHGDRNKSPAAVLGGLLRSFGIAPDVLPRDIESLTAMYRSWLAERRVLMVLDDVFDGNQCVPLFPGNPGCAVIVTVRRRLHDLQGHHEVEVVPLDESSALKLLANVIGEGRLRAELAEARTLVRFCEGIPLVLHIVAAKLAAHPRWRINHIVSRLRAEEHRLDELHVDNSNVRATLSISYESLEEPGRRLLRLLSLLGAADFAFWTAAPLLDCEPDVAEGLLEGLVAAHLVEARREDGVVRYQLHDLVRIYAQERLTHEEPFTERSAALRRLSGCWLSLVTEVHRRVYGGGDFGLLHGTAEHWNLPSDTVDSMMEDPIGWLRREGSALVAAISQASRAGLDELCWDMATTSVTLFESGARADDWRVTHEWALEAVRSAGNHRGEAALLCSLGTLELASRLDVGLTYFEQALKIFEELHDVHGRSLALSGIGFAWRLAGSHAAALSHLEEALSGFREVGDVIGEAATLKDIAHIHADYGRFELAERFLDQALMLSTRIRARRLVAQIEYELASILLTRSRPGQAQESFKLVLQEARHGGDLAGQGYASLGLGETLIMVGDLAEAEQHFHKALELSEQIGNRVLCGRALFAIAKLEFGRQHLTSALAKAGDAVRAFTDLHGADLWRARAIYLSGEVHTALGRTDVAEQEWRSALELAERADPRLAEQISAALGLLKGHKQG